MERKISYSDPFTIKVPHSNTKVIDHGNGLIEIPQDQLWEVTVRFLYVEDEVNYLNGDYWTYNEKDNTVYVKINNPSRLRYLECMKKKIDGMKLTREEELVIEDFKVITQGVSRNAAEKAMIQYEDSMKLYATALSETTDVKEDTVKAAKHPKKEYRTKKNAGACTDKLPTSLAIITNDQYKGGLGLSQTGGAYLYPLATTDGLSYDGKNLFFKGLPTSEATLKEINKDKDIAIDYIDLPLLRMFYSIILSDFEANARQFGVVNETVTVYVPELATLFGKGRNISKNDINTIIDKTSSFQTIYGILKDPQRPSGIGTAVPLLVWLGYDEPSNSIKFASPYMTELIKRIYNVSIRRDKKGVPKLKKNGEPLLEASHSYLVKSNIVKERNKRAAEIVMVVVTTIEQAGNHTPHLKARTIVERVPQLQNAINKLSSQSDKNKLLKRAFTKAWELLRTQTNLQDKYPTIILPDPKNPRDIPTMTTLDKLVFDFPHKESFATPAKSDTDG